MFAKLFRDEPEVLALIAIVALAVFAKPPELPQFRFDLETGRPAVEHYLPRVQFILFR